MPIMIKRILLLFLVLFSFTTLSATHNRAGEITYKQISELTYEVTVTTFTYSPSIAYRRRLTVEWGDNTSSIVEKVDSTILPNYYLKRVFTTTHTYPGPGVYQILVQDPNRNYGVDNIPNSVAVVFSIHTTLIVNPNFGINNTPILLNPPYDKAALGHIFVHNPGAYDTDGDSLSYALTICTREDGKPIENYTFPEASRKFYIDSITGDLVWDAPVKTGIFNVAIEIKEWRNKVNIGVVVRDMQIEVYETDNNPPVTSQLIDQCVEAGDTVDFDISATDADGNLITLKATSGIVSSETDCPATFNTTESGAGYTKAKLRWVPCYSSVRHQPYDIIIKAEDDDQELPLVDIDNMSIKVLGPSPKLLDVAPSGTFFRLSWQNYGTDAIAGFSIYRREGTSVFELDSCTDGMPSSAGYSKVGYIQGSSTTMFTDDNGGKGLGMGKEYSYRITAIYLNGTESKPSDEIIASLVTGVPLITNVSVRSTDATEGSIIVKWQKPKNLDTIPANGPYEYMIYRANGVDGSDYALVKSFTTIDLNDTVYLDTLINTVDRGYTYKIALYNREPGNEFLIGDPGVASSLFIITSPGDRKVRISINRNVPWINKKYSFYRYDLSTDTWILAGDTDQLSWADMGLENGKEYCYYAVSEGDYSGSMAPKNLINYSQRSCATAIDNEPPCPPSINVSSQCDSMYNTIRWSIPDEFCFEDVAGYNLYFKESNDENLMLLATIPDKNVFKYIHQRPEYVSGCYAIKAFDANGNEGERSSMICIDSCNFYEIPNVFTPNNDGFNDLLVAKTSGAVEKVEFKLFNRGGLMIFSITVPKLNWDGTYKDKIVASGVYYYECEVFENRISGTEQFHLSGFIHVITEKGKKPGIIVTK